MGRWHWRHKGIGEAQGASEEEGSWSRMMKMRMQQWCEKELKRHMRGRDVVEQDDKNDNIHWRRMMKLERGTMDKDDDDGKGALEQDDEDGKVAIGTE